TRPPSVAGAADPLPAIGGADRELLDRVVERGPRALRHRDRAIAGQDYADLAHEASPDVARALAITIDAISDQEWIPPVLGAGLYSGTGGVELRVHQAHLAGQVEVVIVPRDAGLQPIPSLELIERVA